MTGGIFSIDTSDRDFVMRDSQLPELSVEEQELADRTSYERIAEIEFDPDEPGPEFVRDDLYHQILGEGMKSLRAPVAIKMDSQKGERYIGKRSPDEEAALDRKEAEKLLTGFRSDLQPVYTQLEGEQEPGTAEVRNGIEELGTRMYSLNRGLEAVEDRLHFIYEHGNRYAAGMRSMFHSGIVDGAPDFNGDGKIDRNDAHALSWLKNSEIFQESFSGRFGSEGSINPKQVTGFAKDRSFFDGESDDSYRIFYEEGAEDGIEGALQSIKAADFLQGGDGDPEIEVEDSPIEVGGAEPEDVLENFDRTANTTPADYNMLLASGYADLSTDGYSEIGGEEVSRLGKNAGVILEPSRLEEAEDGIALSFPASRGFTIPYVAAHEIAHAKGGRHDERTIGYVDIDRFTVAYVDVMYDGSDSLRQDFEEEVDGICYLPLTLDEELDGF